ncbi:MAG: cupin domain-containing protein [Gemmatimonadetes bacterium]|nr:cupin domain-containing protein [Gemmatimonadota bacterium]
MTETKRTLRVLSPDDAAPTVHGAGDAYRFLATGAETGGAYFMLEATVPPGGGPPPHIQTREEEGFYVLEGTVEFLAGEGRKLSAGPGTMIHVPRGVLHSFRNQTDEVARMLIWFAPAGIEQMFLEVGEGSEGYAAIAARYGVEFPHP